MEAKIATWIKELGDFRLRSRAKKALMAAGPEAVDPLVGALGSAEEGVAWSAASALGLIGDRRAMPALVGRLDDPRVGPVASDALARITGHQGPTDRAGWEKYLAKSGFTTGKTAFDLTGLVRAAAEGGGLKMTPRGKNFDVVMRLADGAESLDALTLGRTVKSLGERGDALEKVLASGEDKR
jgi:hypothetical protein